MGRLCERPGCSENGAVAYGMRTEDMVFWLDVLGESSSSEGGVLCQLHGDSMVVPRGWTLDDLRDPELHLFRPPARTDRFENRTRRRSSPAALGDDPEQLELGVLVPPERGSSERATAPTEVIGPYPTSDLVQELTVGVPPTDDSTLAAPDPDDRWTPSFDAADDLGGLLSARSPLLSRAFRGTDRPD